VIGGTPSRIKSLRALRRRMDAELSKAIGPEAAEQRGLTPITGMLGARLWDNVIFAIRTLNDTPQERQPVLVRLREGRFIQVWAHPTDPTSSDKSHP
jgi:hypothetical protein